jgi:hypothetical protein
MCLARYGYIRTHREEILRICNEWGFDGKSLREATEDQFRRMGEIGLSIYIDVNHLMEKEMESSVCTCVGDELSYANPYLADTRDRTDCNLRYLVVGHLV